MNDAVLALWLRLLASHRHLSDTCGEALAPFALGLPEYEVLQRVVRAGDAGLRMQDLARGVLLTESGLTRLAARLEGRGLLSRRPSPDDQRGRVCAATPAGVELWHAARPRFLEAIERALREEAGLTGPELSMLSGLLGRIATTADADEHAAKGASEGGGEPGGATAVGAGARGRRKSARPLG
jgi:DNA-binding MarR family transcriptional regulator